MGIEGINKDSIEQRQEVSEIVATVDESIKKLIEMRNQGRIPEDQWDKLLQVIATATDNFKERTEIKKPEDRHPDLDFTKSYRK